MPGDFASEPFLQQVPRRNFKMRRYAVARFDLCHVPKRSQHILFVIGKSSTVMYNLQCVDRDLVI